MTEALFVSPLYPWDKVTQRIMNDILLTIAIPTYNRASFLDLCLTHICSQVINRPEPIELIICDNASDDTTRDVVAEHKVNGADIKYIVNDHNIGADANIAQCFQLARGKYVLIFGDDDVLLDGALDKVLPVISSNDYGIVYLNSYTFLRDYEKDRPRKERSGVQYYSNHAKFIGRENYWLTFISGNIVNKSHVDHNLPIYSFVDTNLVQLTWTLSALFNANQNAYIEDYLVAVRGANSGGYKLCEVFGVNINKIFTYFIEKGVEKRYFDIVNHNLLFTFFPYNILFVRKYTGDFKAEDFFSVLAPLYRNNSYFWLFTVPVIKLPLWLAKRWISCIKMLHKLSPFFSR